MPKRSMKQDDPLAEIPRAARHHAGRGRPRSLHVAGPRTGRDRDDRDARHQPACGALCPLGARRGDSWSTCLRCSGATGPFPRPKRASRLFRRACVSAEFRAFAADEASPVTQWLRALGAPCPRGMRRAGRGCDRHVLHRQLRAQHDARAGGAGTRPVTAQSLPMESPAATGIAAAELAAVRERLVMEDLTVPGLPLRR